jgi:hypothetical protein
MQECLVSPYGVSCLQPRVSPLAWYVTARVVECLVCRAVGDLRRLPNALDDAFLANVAFS